jgi:hypothetical protein
MAYRLLLIRRGKCTFTNVISMKRVCSEWCCTDSPAASWLVRPLQSRNSNNAVLAFKLFKQMAPVTLLDSPGNSFNLPAAVKCERQNKMLRPDVLPLFIAAIDLFSVSCVNKPCCSSPCAHMHVFVTRVNSDVVNHIGLDRISRVLYVSALSAQLLAMPCRSVCLNGVVPYVINWFWLSEIWGSRGS